MTKIKTVKILNEKSKKVHYADHLGIDIHLGRVIAYRIQCSRQGVRIPLFLGRWSLAKDEPVSCARCLKKKETDNDKEEMLPM